ncbi:MAG: alanine racemase [Rhodospirillaceae bacterium]|nr:alanine racemase [Rhodospirillaceae bacterium]
MARAGAVLTIDLGAIVANWISLKHRVPGAEVAAVVKADAYGLGAVPVAQALAAAGCKTFFVAHLDEGMQLRGALPQPRIFVLHGPNPGTEADFAAAGLIPVLNDVEQVRGWAALARASGLPHSAALQVDTGMTRLGLSRAEFDALVADSESLAALAPTLLMSHFACADDSSHPLTAMQIDNFTAFSRALPGIPASLSASSGIFLGAKAKFDLVRPGIVLYGGNPNDAPSNPMAPVLTCSARVVHVQDIDRPQTVGYGATYTVPGPGRLATVAIGYADGFLRGIGERPDGFPVFADANGVKARLVGRISMDLATYDISDTPKGSIVPGDTIDVIGKYASIDDLAKAAGTISYELLTRLGPRLHRIYRNGTVI